MMNMLDDDFGEDDLLMMVIHDGVYIYGYKMMVDTCI